ncbi:hypothetical protein NADFUDRAFT_48173 [Nadsonia fulvescens var. elongata DSM 6958]|uniref:Uncharacterized protein n=1 Tax=Nadsonia fulvescens var. elongata DSM 6958 TaxID=857566 RepID=A0A1E3PD36_9ASCO|nr:hypothetical protein NADFUDRAFT_48173 [Nadsonia fulvescens var. elongata DSM 6958]
MGQSIHVDILHHMDPNTTGPSQRAQLWIRVPQPDAVKVRSALSGFSSSMDLLNGQRDEVFLRVVRASEYLIGVTGPRRANPGF